MHTPTHVLAMSNVCVCVCVHRQASDAYQNLCGWNCTIINIYSSDYYNTALSQYYYQLSNGSCNNIFSSTDW
jgi:hypothetical protein